MQISRKVGQMDMQINMIYGPFGPYITFYPFFKKTNLTHKSISYQGIAKLTQSGRQSGDEYPQTIPIPT